MHMTLVRTFTACLTVLHIAYDVFVGEVISMAIAQRSIDHLRRARLLANAAIFPVRSRNRLPDQIEESHPQSTRSPYKSLYFEN